MSDQPTPNTEEPRPGRSSAFWYGLALAAALVVLLILLAQCARTQLFNSQSNTVVIKKTSAVIYPPPVSVSPTTAPLPIPSTAASGPVVPKVVGMTASEGEGEVSAAGYAPSINWIGSTQPIGTIVAQSPAGGTSADLGSTVVLGVSEGGGVKLVVPNVVGLSVAAAKSKIEAAGFRPLAVRRPSGPFPIGKAAQQWPHAGNLEPAGSQVSFIYAVPSQ